MTRRLPVLATGAAVALTVPVLRRMRRKFDATGELSPPTVAAMYACYAAHATATAQAARHRSGALPLFPRAGAWAGAVLIAAGMTLCAAGMDRFASVGQISGTDIGDLMTGGVYRYSRNPQYTGYIALLSGVGLARRSGGVLALAGAAALVFRWWVPVEEDHLERDFDATYRRYRNQTPAGSEYDTPNPPAGSATGVRPREAVPVADPLTAPASSGLRALPLDLREPCRFTCARRPRPAQRGLCSRRVAGAAGAVGGPRRSPDAPDARLRVALTPNCQHAQLPDELSGASTRSP